MLAIRGEQAKLVADFEKNSAELWSSNNNELNELATRMRNLEEKFIDADKRFGKLESLLEEVTFYCCHFRQFNLQFQHLVFLTLKCG